MASTSTKPEGRRKYRFILILSALVLFVVIVMALHSRKPEPLVFTDTKDPAIRGERFVRANQLLIEQMFRDWLPNDLFWPTVFLDNMPNFQIGELEVVRYNVRVLRDNLTRMRTTDYARP